MTELSKRSGRWLLVLLLAAGGLALIMMTWRAISVRSVFDNSALMSDVWFQVTLLDAYLGFLIFYILIAWKETTIAAKVIWFVLLMCFGNMAACGYLILQMIRLPAGHSPAEILRRQYES